MIVQYRFFGGRLSEKKEVEDYIRREGVSDTCRFDSGRSEGTPACLNDMELLMRGDSG